MCGICGIVDFTDRPIESEVLDAMRDVMVTRGPDDADTVILAHAGLAHRRLSIIDLSPSGRQPMTNEDGSVWLVFNGEIYNFLDLRGELEDRGHGFRSQTDSEVLIHGYEEWGIEELLRRINGMFGFAIWDAKQAHLLLARDRLGKKPVFYASVASRILFASDIRAVWQYHPGTWKVREESLASFLYWQYIPGRQTAFENVLQLLPGHYLRVTRTGMEERRFWKLSFANKFRGPVSEVQERTEQIVERAVRRRMRSDVPLGAFLSGGVDSSYVVSWMVDHATRQVRTFAIGSGDPAHDERGHARAVAEHLNTDHTEFQVSANAWELLPRLVWAFGQPFGDAAAIPTYYVSKCARQHVTVALTGDGGDESFAGYSHHQGRRWAASIQAYIPGAIIETLLARGERILDSGKRNMMSSAARFLRYAHPDPLIARANVNAWTLHHLEDLWTGERRRLVDADVLMSHSLELTVGFDGQDPLDRALFEDLHMLLPFCYNVKLDVATMMNSLEARSPFQDVEVVEWAARIDPGMKMRLLEKKSMLKRLAAARVPREVIYRPKHGFSIPMDRWFLDWGDTAREFVLGKVARDRGLFDYAYLERLWAEHQERRARHGARFWMLLWLELWFRMFVDRTLSPEAPMPELQGSPA